MIEQILKTTETSIVKGKIELFYKDGLFQVVNNALKVKTQTQSLSFESALQTFWDLVNKN